LGGTVSGRSTDATSPTFAPQLVQNSISGAIGVRHLGQLPSGGGWGV
jgi:hypothetical protein